MRQVPNPSGLIPDERPGFEIISRERNDGTVPLAGLAIGRKGELYGRRHYLRWWLWLCLHER